MSRHKKTTEEFKKEVYDLVGDEYSVLGDYINTKAKIKVRHNICKLEYEVSPTNFLSGKRCPKCAKKEGFNKQKTRTTESIKKEVYDLVGDEYSVLGEYINSNTPILFQHNKCGYQYKILPRHFIINGRRCRKCAGTLKYTTEEFKKEVYDLVGDEYSVLGEYINSQTPIKFKHNKCGHKWTIQPTYFINIQSTRCPKCCLQGTSQEEKELQNYVQMICKENNLKVICNSKKVISPYELDIYAPEIKLAIEFNGNYWHSEINLEKPYHFHKFSLCEEKEINLLNIWEYDWIKKKDTIKNYIFSLINEEKLKRIENSLNLKVKQIKKNEKDFFLQKNYIYNENDSSVIYLGIFNEINELISVLTLNKSYQIVTYCKKLDYMNDNIFIKLFIDYLKQNLKINSIVYKINRSYLVFNKVLKSVLKQYSYELPEEFLEYNNLKIYNEGFSLLYYNLSKSEIERYFSDYNKNLENSYIVYLNQFTTFIKSLSKKNDIKINIEKNLFIFPINNLKIYFLNPYSYTDKKDQIFLEINNEDKTYRKIIIFPDEWINEKNLVKEKIKTLLKLNKNKIYARECYIKETSSIEYKEFLNQNHIQKSSLATIYLGLYTSTKYYETEKLVAVMTFCKPRKALGQSSNSLYDYELSRYASLKNCNIIGGFSKLLKYFERNYKWKKIITYADKRWSVGELYKKCDFQHIRDSKPNYWYLNKKDFNRIYRYQYRKSSLKHYFPEIYNENKTEKEIMEEAGFLRVYDCGNMVFEYKNSL